MNRRLRQLDRLDEVARSGPRRSGARRRERSERSRSVMVWLGVAVICLGAWQLTGFGPLRGAADDLAVGPNGSPAWPPRPDDTAKERLSPAVHPAYEAASFKFTATQPGSAAPVRYDPCTPIHVVVNPRTAFPGARTLVDQAIDQVERATGLRLVLDGSTSEAPVKDRPLRLEQYGEGWAPVLLAWSDPDEVSRLRGRVAGLGGSASAIRHGHRWYVTGVVTLDGPQLGETARRPGVGSAQARSVIMHELGHLVGLAHIKAAGELMQPKAEFGLTTWGPGDRTGLAALGAGNCVDY